MILTNRFISLLCCYWSVVCLSSQDLPDMSSLAWRNIGPANQGGRIVDIEAVPGDFTSVFLATGSGGVWKSVNAGTTWKPIFDDYETASIGDIALGNNPQIVWVGTGEPNNRNSTSWGNGMYLSTNGGESFTHKGLANTHHIARVLTHPKNENEVCVCAIGHLWGVSGDRGLYKSEDLGDSWTKLQEGLPSAENSGCTDIVRDPKNPNILYAAFYQRIRYPYRFYSGGDDGGIFKSTNGGKSWSKLTNGLPTGPTGRIGLAISASNPKVVMALVEAEQSNDLSKPGSGVYRSEDAGKTWKYINTYNNRPFYYSQIRINPLDDQRVYLLTTRFMVSTDGGMNFSNGSEDQEVHGDFHAMWLDPNDKDRYYLGADKGASLSHDHGAHFQLFDNFAIGQFYRIGLDNRQPYYVYGGLQDNGFYGTASFSREIRGILNDSNWKLHWGDGQYTMADPDNPDIVFTSSENGNFLKYHVPTHRIDRISPNPRNIVNFSDYLTESGEAPMFRFNWSAPMKMAPHPTKNIYVAGNHVFRSTDQGKSWSIISPDLSTQDPHKSRRGVSGGVTPDNTGAETHCAISTLSISPINESILWVGTDDGQVHVSQDNGHSWQSVRSEVPGVPDSIWVSRLEASHFQPGRAYLTFDGHRSDVFQPFVFVTEDYGQSWKPIHQDLDETEVVRVIREDVQNPDLLFIGTETGIWMSLDRGEHWQRMQSHFPTVSVYDLEIHPRDRDLVAGTHGRSIWVLDDISPLEQWNPGIQESAGHLFEQPAQILWENTSRGGQRGHFWYGGSNPPEIRPTSSIPRGVFAVDVLINYYLNLPDTNAAAQLIIEDSHGHRRTITLPKQNGIHRYRWDRQFDLLPYSNEDKQAIEESLSYWKSQISSNSLRNAIERFLTSTDLSEQRRTIESLRTGFFQLPLDPTWGMPQAGPGVYTVKMVLPGGASLTQSIELKADQVE